MSSRLKRMVEVLVGVALAAIVTVVHRVAEAQDFASTKDDPSAPSTAQKSTNIVVRSGDSLWSISRQWLGTNASPRRITEGVEQIYALNRNRKRRLDGYRLERAEDVLTLRRHDGSLVGHFSARGATTEGILRVIEDDRLGYPQYAGAEEHAESLRRFVRVRMHSPWERFLNTERRTLEARRKGQLAKALLRALPRESQQEIDRMTSEDRCRAEEGFVELRSEEGESFYKHVEQLGPEDRQERIRAELRRLEWLLERQKARNILIRSASCRWRPPHKELEPRPSDTVVTAHDKGKPAVRRGRKAHGPLPQRGSRVTERSQIVPPIEYEEGRASVAKAMVGIYFASKEYMEAYMAAYRAFRHAQTAEEQGEEKLIEAVSRLRELVAHCALYLSEHPEEEVSIEQVIDQLVMKSDK